MNIAKSNGITLNLFLKEQSKPLLSYAYCTLIPEETTFKTRLNLDTYSESFFDLESEDFIPPDQLVKTFNEKTYAAKEYAELYQLILNTANDIGRNIQENAPKRGKEPKEKIERIDVKQMPSSPEITKLKKKKPIIPKKKEKEPSDDDQNWDDVEINRPPEIKIIPQKDDVIIDEEINEDEVHRLTGEFMKYATNAHKFQESGNDELRREARKQAKERLVGLARLTKENSGMLISILNNPKLKDSIKQFYDVGGVTEFKENLPSDKQALEALQHTEAAHEMEEQRRVERERRREEGRRLLEQRREEDNRRPKPGKVIIPEGLEDKIPKKPL